MKATQRPEPIRGIFRERVFWYALLAMVLSQLFLATALDNDIFAHNPYDQYTLQAMTWRDMRIALSQDYPWLELAKYQGAVYVSFPPFPALPMLLLSFIFGGDTPSTLVTMLYYTLAFVTAYALARRYTDALQGAMCALFACLGCNLCEVTLYGGVWNMAQSLGFLLTMLCAFGVTSASRPMIGIGLFALACAVGCRPFQALYVPAALYLAYVNCGKSLKKLWPLLIAPGLMALLYAGYNFIRFGNIMEFGHNYLPEFAEQSEYGQFSLQYMPSNLQHILRLPYFEGNRLRFPSSHGFLFFFANPLFLLFAIRAVFAAAKRAWDMPDTLIVIGITLHFTLLLMHKSYGGWQFGTRYLCDLIPFMFLFWLRKMNTRLSVWEVPVMIFAVMFNIYGTIVFHAL